MNVSGDTVLKKNIKKGFLSIQWIEKLKFLSQIFKVGE